MARDSRWIQHYYLVEVSDYDPIVIAILPPAAIDREQLNQHQQHREPYNPIYQFECWYRRVQAAAAPIQFSVAAIITPDAYRNMSSGAETFGGGATGSAPYIEK